MTVESMVGDVLKQGGFAALAALALWLYNRQYERHVADLKDSLSREIESRRDIRAIVDGTLVAMQKISSEMSALTASVNKALEDTWHGRRKADRPSQV